MIQRIKIALLISILFFLACEKNDIDVNSSYSPTPAPLNIPELFKEKILPPLIPVSNPQTNEGIFLGKKLFFDPILSADGTQACADCHAPENAFTDADRFSEGIDKIKGSRNSMPIFNTAWNYDEKFFWDGRAFSLENQALEPVKNPIEMHNTWIFAMESLQKNSEYPELFFNAFGTSKIDSMLVTNALAQFERTLISGNSRFDKHLQNKITLTDSELNGFDIFMSETKGDCFHCHGNANNPLWTDNIFHNNGLDAVFTDLGLGKITGDPADNGKFKTPSLRNLKFTAPYMHDGRFQTLDQVINHYSEGLVNSPTIDPLMKAVNRGGVQLSESEKIDLKNFLLSLSDDEFINNPEFNNPN